MKDWKELLNLENDEVMDDEGIDNVSLDGKDELSESSDVSDVSIKKYYVM